MPSRRSLTLSLCLLALFWNLPVAATSVLPISLQRMAAAADVIFHGTVIDNRVERDPASGNAATYTTFEVTELVKGKTGATHTIKQIGGELPGGGMRQIIHGVPRFSPGQEYVVFLPKASSLGFASPIGLKQGRFEVSRINGQAAIVDRRAMAATGAAPLELPEIPGGVETGLPETRGVALEDFLQSVRAMAGN